MDRGVEMYLMDSISHISYYSFASTFLSRTSFAAPQFPYFFFIIPLVPLSFE